jgi:hypothetical protein
MQVPIKKLNIQDGFETYLASLKKVFSDRTLSRWYRKTIFKTVAVSLVLLLLLLGVGAWAVQYYVQELISSLILTLIVVFLSLYFSATLSALLMNSLVLVIGGEKILRETYFPGQQVMSGFRLKERGAEFISILKSLGFALLALPFWFIPYLIPFGIMIVALGLGGESMATAHRLAHEYGVETVQDRKEGGWKVNLGLGLIPAMTAMIPIFGFLFLPISVLAAIEIQSRHQIRSRP